MSEVIYHELAEFPGYRVGADGSVWSRRHRKLADRPGGGWHRLKMTTRKSGYVTACFRVGPRKNVVRYVHHLVLEAFVGSCPEGMECRHGPSGPSDNRVGNLSWGTRQQNAADRRRDGTHLVGSQSPQAKFSERDVAIMRHLAGEGVDLAIIAAAFGTGRRYMRDLVDGRVWQHVP